MMTEKRQHNALSFENRYKLCEWIKNNKRYFIGNNSWEEVEKFASESLMIKITRHNIAAHASAVGVRISADHSRPVHNDGSKKGPLKKHHENQAKKIRSIARAFLQLCDELAFKPTNIDHIMLLAENDHCQDGRIFSDVSCMTPKDDHLASCPFCGWCIDDFRHGSVEKCQSCGGEYGVTVEKKGVKTVKFHSEDLR